MLDFFITRYGYDAMMIDADIGIDLVVRGYQQHTEDKLYLRWLFDYGNGMSFASYKSKLMSGHDGYRKSTKEEKEYILKKYGS